MLEEDDLKRLRKLARLLEEHETADMDYLRLLLRNAEQLERLAQYTDTLVRDAEVRRAWLILRESWRNTLIAVGGVASVIVLFKDQLREVWKWLSGL